LFVNPGGPGGSTIDILSGWSRSMPQEIRSRFDIVLMDPRGVGESSPLICHDNIQELLGLDPYPETDADWREIEDAIKEMTSQCADAGGDILPFLGTESVARDMDRIRDAMGDDQLTYFGYSYGTTIGQVYADLFPGRVRAMVLDGAVDLSLDADTRWLEQTVGFEAAYNRFLADCRSRSCLPGDPAKTISDLIEKARQNPIPARTGDRPLGGGEALFGIVGSLYNKASWLLMSSSIKAAMDGDGSALLFLVDSFLGREGDGYNNSNEMNSAVNCLDFVNERDPQHYRELSKEFAAAAPFFGEALASTGLYCAFWEADPKPLHTPTASGAAPIVVIGNTGDPATPYKWAVALASQLESAVLITHDAEGHTAYRAGSNCIDDAIDAYLVDLTVPPDGKRCGNANITPSPPVSP
jgi:pimeloyl-ACP methyl ester carboxylesterase